MQISFDGIGSQIVTAKCTSNLKKGDLCYFYTDRTVAPATASSGFSGKVVEVYSDRTASVQIHGYIEVPYADSTPLSTLDLQNYVCANATSIRRDQNGRPYLVVHQDIQNHIVGILL